MVPDSELPVLNAVVQAGDKNIIDSSRTTAFARPTEDAIPTNVIDLADTMAAGRLGTVAENTPSAEPLQPPLALLSDDALETLIDDIVERHVTALRKDLRQLLERARHAP